MKNLVLIITLLIVLYSSLYFIFKEEITIQQIQKNNISLDILINKQPIIIEDKLNKKEINDLFKYNIIEYPNVNNIWNRNQYKYILITAINNTNIFISNPKKIKFETPNEKDIVIDIQLKKNQSLILSFKWYYSLINNEDIEIYGIHDYITYGLNFIF
tara:strand:- start:851 stop:1324 length:474 start_codon:yes stop_codon:yes gene_type:complete